MEPKDFSNAFNRARQEIKYTLDTGGLSRKRQILARHLNDLHAMQMTMIEDAVQMKEYQDFPEANQVINYIKAL